VSWSVKRRGWSHDGSVELVWFELGWIYSLRLLAFVLKSNIKDSSMHPIFVMAREKLDGKRKRSSEIIYLQHLTSIWEPCNSVQC
jgi:hypothetical protein